jgi:hypothetical protein
MDKDHRTPRPAPVHGEPSVGERSAIGDLEFGRLMSSGRCIAETVFCVAKKFFS